MLGVRVAIVEDAGFVREMLRSHLELAGFHVVAEIASGSQATEELEKLRPDWAIIDIVLPNQNGVVVAEQLRKAGVFFPILFVSSLDREFALGSIAKVSASSLLEKPFTQQSLLQSIKSLEISTREDKVG